MKTTSHSARTRWCRFALAASMAIFFASPSNAQLFSRETEFLKLIYYDKAHEPLTFHLTRSFENSLEFHRKLWDYTPSEPIITLFQDFGDFGHGGTSTVPWNYFSIGIEPFDYVYETMPANERMNWLMHHELVHVVATDKGADRDLVYRRLFHGKVPPEQKNPISMYYSFLTSPRWYAPRWYHEGIAVFLETWMAGGLGRVLGGYDEMTFRAMVLEDAYFYDVVGLESEGTTIDFQVGQNSYLYGTRFVTWMADKYGPEKLIAWFNRTPGSKRYFSSQFRNVYGTDLNDEWSLWIASEHAWQKKNLERIREYPVTKQRRIREKSLGSVSRSWYEPETGKLYAAVNFPANPAQIAAIDLATGKLEKLTEVSGPALYYVSSVAYDPKGKKIYFTSDNTRGWRDLNEYDLRTRKSRQITKDLRTGDLAVNPADQAIWGVQHHNGFSSLIRITSPFKTWQTVLTLEYGRDIFDIDISPDGRMLSCGLIEIDGTQRLVTMDTGKLLAGDASYEVIHQFGDNGPANFVFSPDGRYLFGTSYVTGVSNVFRYDFETKKMEAITNVESGLFRPVQISDHELVAYSYTAKGLVPVVVPIEVREDINAIHYFGQKVVEDHPQLKDWMAGSPGRVNLDKVTTYTGEYKAGNRIRPAAMYPVIEGYKDSTAVGMRFNFSDPLGLHSLHVTAAVSPDNSLDDSEKLHFSAEYEHSPWKASLLYNPTNFYDLFGPTKVSRKGYSAQLSYHDYLIFERPRTLTYDIGGSWWGGLDTLPDFQNVPTSFSKVANARARLDYSNMRRTIGAVDNEKGVEWSLVSRVNYVDSELIPMIEGSFDKGFMLPIEHSSIWLRAAAGASFRGDRDEPFANFFFGGFGNNWVDYQEARRYRDSSSFPGVEIDEIGGTDFGKLTLEWTLPPVRFQRVGVPGFYSNWARLALFTSGLVTNMSSSEDRHELSAAGAQVDFSMVMFSNLESTLSFGYAKANEHGNSSDEFMVSLKLLK